MLLSTKLDSEGDNQRLKTVLFLMQRDSKEDMQETRNASDDFYNSAIVLFCTVC